MINLERTLTKSQRRKNKKRQAEAQRIELRKQRKNQFRKLRQKSKKNRTDLELRKHRKLRDFRRNHSG